MKNHSVRAFQPRYLADYRIVKVVNENTVIVATPDSRERKCNVNHIKPFHQLRHLLEHLRISQNVSKETILTC